MSSVMPSCCKSNLLTILDDKARRYMTMILEASKRMGSLIDDL